MDVIDMSIKQQSIDIKLSVIGSTWWIVRRDFSLPLYCCSTTFNDGVEQQHRSTTNNRHLLLLFPKKRKWLIYPFFWLPHIIMTICGNPLGTSHKQTKQTEELLLMSSVFPVPQHAPLQPVPFHAVLKSTVAWFSNKRPKMNRSSFSP